MLDHTSIAWEETLLHHQINTGEQGEYLYWHTLSDNMRQFVWMGMTQHIRALRVEESSDDPAFGSPHSSKIIRSYTQGDLLCQSPVFKTQGVLGHPDWKQLFLPTWCFFLPASAGLGLGFWDGRLQTKDHVHLVWLQQNIQAETQYPLQPPASKRGRSVCKNHFQFSQHEI